MSVENDNPKSLTTSQRMLVDQLVEHFGEQHTNAKRLDIRKALEKIAAYNSIPGWIVNNKKVKIKNKRGRYNLAVLLKLPVVAFKERATRKRIRKPKTEEGIAPLTASTIAQLDSAFKGKAGLDDPFADVE